MVVPAGNRDCDAEWHADVLRQRLAAVSRAVVKKGGWHSAVFLDGERVNIDVDIGPWPAADGILMLQTVKNALLIQLEEVSAAGKCDRRTPTTVTTTIMIHPPFRRHVVRSIFNVFDVVPSSRNDPVPSGS